MKKNSKENENIKIKTFSYKTLKKQSKNDFIVNNNLNRDIEIKEGKLNVRLGRIFYEIQKKEIEPNDTIQDSSNFSLQEIILPSEDPYILHPHSSVLAQTFEYISMPNDLVGILHGRSSLGRLGIIIHANAGLINPGYKGVITLEISNLGNLVVRLYPLQDIATVEFLNIKG